MRVQRRQVVDAPLAQVWAVVADPSGYPEALGFGEWQPRGEQTTGVGARYRVRLPIGTILLGGEVEVVECDHRHELAWHSVTGVDHRGRWRLRACRDGAATDVTLRVAYQAPGGLLGLLAGHVASPYVGRQLDRALDRLARAADRAPLR